MKIIITQEQFNVLKETKKEKVSCSKCDHSWEIEKKDKHPHLCHMCGYDSKSKKHNYEELENFWKGYKKEEVTEKWSEKYKKSINCNNPKGFSQRAHCQGRKKRLKESKMDDGYDMEKIKKGIKILSQLSETFGEFIPLQFKLYGYHIKRGGGLKIMVLYIDVNSEEGVYDPSSGIWYEISQQLLQIFEMLDIRDEKYMNPLYDFKFNKRPLENVTIV
jgi:hypothetical protein